MSIMDDCKYTPSLVLMTLKSLLSEFPSSLVLFSPKFRDSEL